MEILDRSAYTSLETTALRNAAGPSAVPSRAVAPANTVGGQLPVGDSSELSPAARIAAEAALLPDVRQERVASLQQQIASGSYQVSATDVADSLLRQFRS